MSESPFNPVAPAIADALRDATGVRFTEPPFTADRIRLRLRSESPGRDIAYGGVPDRTRPGVSARPLR